MALIELHPQLSETNKLLNRIATVLERWLLIEHGIALGSAAQPAVDPNPREKPTVTYHTDENTLREEMKTLQGWREHGESVEDEIEEEEFGV
jgi:hypothetical protein